MAGSAAPAESPRVLIVDDDRTQAELLANMLGFEGFDVTAVFSPSDAMRSCAETPFPVVISDFNMPEMNGVELFRELSRDRDDLVFIIITAFGTLETAVEAMKVGIHDFVTKPVDVAELAVKLEKALHLHSLEVENRDLKGAIEALRQKVRIIGDSPRTREILEKVQTVSQSPATVLIQGESGTGKELVARAIHVQSQRHTGPYIKVNCAAIPENLLEAELFGHRKGSFTGAVSDRKGRFEMAHRGTLLLDEVGDMPFALQPKLLRVIQEKEVEPIGSTETIPVDIRLIASTHRDLKAMVKAGTFREDLFYRLNVIPIEIPPLRERSEDILPLAHHFLLRFSEENLRRFEGFTRGAEERLLTYTWPGNVRELENALERAVVLGTAGRIREEDLMLAGPRMDDTATLETVLSDLFNTPLTLDDLERDIILAALERCGGNLSRTARTLGLTRRALQYRVEKIRSEEPQDDTSSSSSSPS